MPLPEFPQKVENLIGEELEGLSEVIYVRPEDGGSFSLNITASSVLELCDGRRSHADIARFLADNLPEDSAPGLERISADVETILTSFVDYGLIYVDEPKSA